MTFEEDMRQLLRRNPYITLSEAIGLVDNPQLTTQFLNFPLTKQAEWILTQEDLLNQIRMGQTMIANGQTPAYRIRLIKEVRARTASGLKEAKESVDCAIDLYRQGWQPPVDPEVVAEEERQAIASIKEHFA